jgi:uridylate kinase
MDPDPQPKYKRILLKISGEALAGSGSIAISPDSVNSISNQIKEIENLGIQIILIPGGGNIFRGQNALKDGINRIDADYMGMLATVINAMAVKARLENIGTESRVLSAITHDAFTEPYSVNRAKYHLDKGRPVILAGGTGNPFFSTDTAAALRASELNADVILKATKVDGVYSSDPVSNSKAEFYPRLSFMDVVEKGLRVMDLTAITMCKDNDIPIIVFDISKPGNIKRAAMGEKIGTIIS